MKAIAACPTCILEQSKDGKQPRFNPVAGELDDNGSIHVTCEHKHYGVVVYNERRYSVLVKSAARAFLDGYTNEVVAVMSSALERAYEFYIRVSCAAKGVNPQAFEAAWKVVASQSERQLGAFQFLYLLDHGHHLSVDQAIPQTRNKVVHQGHIIREAGALEYAEKVFAIVDALDSSMQSMFPSHYKEEAEREVRVQQEAIPPGVEYLTLSMATVSVDTNTNIATRTVNKFVEHVAAIHHARSNGFPL
jgi:hypothetical protein